METIVDLLSASVERYGSLPALVIKPGFRTDRWTYRRLDEQSSRIAGYLASRGVQAGDRILMWAPNRPEWIAAYFGVLKVGAVVVPADVRSAPDFVERIGAQVEAKLLILGRQGMPGDISVNLPTLFLEDLPRLAAGSVGDHPPKLTIGGDDLAHVMFTSGTTGDPKGVMLTHRNIVSNVVATRPVFPITPGHRLLSLLPLSHMFEVTAGLLAPLYGGGRIAYPVSRQPSVIFRTMRENRVTSLVVVPQALQLFMNGIEREVARQGKSALWARLNRLADRLPMRARRILFRSVHRQFGGRLNEIISGGAYLDPDLGRKWERLGIAVQQGYGTTETAPAITFNRAEGRRLDSVGTVLPGQEVRIAADGEVLTRGPNVTPGYWRNPVATAAVFEDGWYKTGDLGQIEPDGNLVLKGRKKDLIVLANGQNVYPDDIEGVLRRHDNVADAVVLGVTKPGGDVDVTAVLLLREPGETKPIVEWANAQLADHQHIAATAIWTEPDFPRTHTLKVKKPLVQEWLQGQGSGATDAPPVAVVAEQAPPLYRIIAELAERPVSAISPGLTLGGDLSIDSLGRVELLSYVDQELGIYIDEAALSPNTTVAELERLVASGAGSTGKLKSYRWAQLSWARAVREVFLGGFVFPLLGLLYRLDVFGRENLKDVKGPVLIAANHCLHLDNPLIMKALPGDFRRRLAIAAAADDIFGSWRGPFAALLGNAFPFSREGAIRHSLERLGELLDEGYSILIYPEGKLTVGGPMQPFKSGTGLVATESKTAVIPIRFDVERFGPAEGHFWPPRAHVRVHIGKPIEFGDSSSANDATRQLEEAVRTLK